MSGRWTVRARGSATRGRPVARAARDWTRGRPVGRPRARAEQARGAQARAGHPCPPAGSRPDGREPPCATPRRERRRRPARPAARVRHREPVEGGVACGRRGSRRGARWARRTDVELRRGARRGRSADAGVRRLRSGGTRDLPARRSPVSALPDADRVSRSGRREPDRLLVPGMSAAGERSGATGRVSGRVIRSPNLHHALRAFCLGAFAAVSAGAGRRRRRPVLVRGAPGAREPDALRVPAAREALPRRARRAVRGARGCAARARGAGAGAGGGDLRAGALEWAAELPGGADPHGAPAAPRRDGRGLRRLRLGRRRFRPCLRRVRGARSSARSARTARSRRSWGCLPEGSSISAEGSAFAMSPRASWQRTGRRPAGCFRRGSSASRTASASSSWRRSSAIRRGRSRAACPTRRASSPTRSRRCGSRPPARLPPAPCSSSGSTGGRTGFVRCCRSRRQRRRAKACAWTRCAPSGPGGSASGSRRRTTTAISAEALDRWELSLFQTDPFASEQLRGSLTSLLGGGEGLVRRRRCERRPCSARRPRERSAILDRLRLLAAGDAAAATSDLVRSALVAVLEHGDRSVLLRTLDETLLGLRRKPTVAPEPALAVGAL